MAGVKRDWHGLEVEREEAERLSQDDVAGRTADEWLADALLAQQLRAAGGELVRCGVCSNCQAQCLPLAVYCDAECRADHEKRLAAVARAGRTD